MDWRAIEDNERLIRDAVARKTAIGTDEALVAAAGARLQLGFIRPWIVWVNEEKGNPNRLIEAFTEVTAAMICEVAKNFIYAGADLTHKTFVEEILRVISATARADAENLDAGDTSMNGTYIRMDQKPDA